MYMYLALYEALKLETINLKASNFVHRIFFFT